MNKTQQNGSGDQECYRAELSSLAFLQKSKRLTEKEKQNYSFQVLLVPIKKRNTLGTRLRANWRTFCDRKTYFLWIVAISMQLAKIKAIYIQIGEVHLNITVHLTNNFKKLKPDWHNDDRIDCNGVMENWRTFTTEYNFQKVSTFFAPCISESCIKIKINLYFYFHTSSWCFKRSYKGF